MLDKLEQLTLSCMKCGNCRAVCPTFRELGDEGSSPRARVRLVRGLASGEVELSARYGEIIGTCINCRACADECPSGMAPNEVVLNARRHLILEKGLPLVKRAIFRRALRARRMFPASAKLLGMLQRAVLIGNPYSPARLALPLMGLKLDKRIPYFALRTFRERVPEVVPAQNRKHRVAYFVGCSANLIYPEVGEAVVGLLTHHGVEVVIPPGQMCCGTPVFNAGDFEGGAYLAEQNVRAFADLDVDAVITACGSCGLALKQEWRDLLGLQVPDELTGKVYDFAEFLTDCLGVDSLEAPEPTGSLSLTYHDPCHLDRGMMVKSQPRHLLSSLPRVELVEMADADQCCGGGGAFSIYYPDLSRDIGARKAENVSGTGAGTVVTGCPVCIIQLEEMLRRAGSLQKVVHTACVLWQALKGER